MKTWKAMIKDFFSKFRQWWIVGLAGVLIGAFPKWYPILININNYFSPKFKVFFTGFDKSFFGPFSLVCKIGRDDFKRFPSDFAFLVEIINKDERPKRIIGYAVEEKISFGWVDLQQHTCSSILEINSTDRESYIQTFVSPLNQVIYSKTINQGESIKGWVFLSRKNKQKKSSSESKFRLVIVDHNDTISRIEKSEAPTISGNIDPYEGVAFIPKPSWVK